ncbi:hypothetical protein BC833DRAFT_608397 [Globomyces pollinis-pini]|nr:hypothetical protein BC833DRAFT_608397 [Globomyces pollinis-pini]
MDHILTLGLFIFSFMLLFWILIAVGTRITQMFKKDTLGVHWKDRCGRKVTKITTRWPINDIQVSRKGIDIERGSGVDW